MPVLRPLESIGRKILQRLRLADEPEAVPQMRRGQ
jgi:hypothetical protein